MRLDKKWWAARKAYVLWVVIVFALAVAIARYFSAHYRIAIDTQLVPCLDARVLLIDLDDRKPVIGAIFAFTAPESASPVYPRGTLMAKRVMAGPGDTVSVTAGGKILVNGTEIARGMPHLSLLSLQERDRFYGQRLLKDGEWWMVGESATSFDSRYWGPLKEEQVVGRAHVIY